MQLELSLPTKQTPGFLRRSREALKFKARLESKQFDASIFDEVVEFLLPFVTKPENKDEAREALLDASQEQFETALSAILGGDEIINPPSAETSNSSTSPD